MMMTFIARSTLGPFVENYSLASLKGMPENHSHPICKKKINKWFYLGWGLLLVHRLNSEIIAHFKHPLHPKNITVIHYRGTYSFPKLAKMIDKVRKWPHRNGGTRIFYCLLSQRTPILTIAHRQACLCGSPQVQWRNSSTSLMQK